MTEKTVAAKPIQPTVFTEKINAVQPSRFASSIKFERFADTVSNMKPAESAAPTQFSVEPEKENPRKQNRRKMTNSLKFPNQRPFRRRGKSRAAGKTDSGTALDTDRYGKSSKQML